MTERSFDLVVPLAHEATDMRIADTAGSSRAWSSAVSPLDGSGLRGGDVDRTKWRGTRTSTTAIRTTTTSTTSSGPSPSADRTPSHHAGFSFHDLVQAYLDCRRAKRNSQSALAFEENLEENLVNLFDELQAGTYQPGSSACFIITRPKPREVWAAPFRDRIPHHLLYNAIAPAILPTFIADTCACIPGRGTLYAVDRLEQKLRSITQNWTRPAYYLKCDLANFFVAIDKHIVWDLLEKRISDASYRWLAHRILFNDPRQGAEIRATPAQMRRVPAHKSLLNQVADRGLPIGNLSSQFFANVYLDPLDQFVKHELRCRRYVRYVDDFILLSESSAHLVDALARITAFLPALLRAEINPRKTILQPVDRGVDFAGQLIKPHRRVLRRRTVSNALATIARMPGIEIRDTANSYFGLLRQTDSKRDRIHLANALRRRGHSIDAALTRTFQRTNS